MCASALAFALVVASLSTAARAEEGDLSDKRWLEVRQKTPTQLKEMMKEEGVAVDEEWTWDEVWSKAYREDIVTKWKTRHPEFREEMEIMENLAKSVRDGSTAEGDPERSALLARLESRGIKIAGVDMPIEKLRALEMGLGHAAGPDADTEGLQEFLLGGRKSGTPLVKARNGELSEADRAFMSQNGFVQPPAPPKKKKKKRTKEAKEEL